MDFPRLLLSLLSCERRNSASKPTPPKPSGEDRREDDGGEPVEPVSKGPPLLVRTPLLRRENFLGHARDFVRATASEGEIVDMLNREPDDAPSPTPTAQARDFAKAIVSEGGTVEMRKREPEDIPSPALAKEPAHLGVPSLLARPSAPNPNSKAFPDINASGPAAAAEAKERGNDCFRNKAFPEALLAYSEALVLYPDDDAVWINRSIVNRMLRDWVEAAKDAKHATELAPANTKAYYSLALSLQQQKKFQAALEACEAGLRVQPDHKALLQLKDTLEREEADAAAQAALPPKCPAELLSDREKRGIMDANAFIWKQENPSIEEREHMRKETIDMFRKRYIELSQSMQAAKKKSSTLETSMYNTDQKDALKIQGGHQPMDRPDDVVLPAEFQSRLGEITVAQLSAFNSDNANGRHCLSVYGDVFDVSDRPDKYGPDSPYADLTGKDISWGLFTGVDTGRMCNQFYDFYKAKDQGVDKIAGVCSWRAWYEQEYGVPVGSLVEYKCEHELPSPPLGDIEEVCCMM